MFWKKKKKNMLKAEDGWQYVPYHQFLFKIPAEWTWELTENGKIKAKKGEEIRMTVTGYQIERSKYHGRASVLQNLTTAYAESDYVAAYNEIQRENYSVQMMDYDKKPICLLGVVDKFTQKDALILTFAFNSNEAELLRANAAIAIDIMDSVMESTIS